MEASLLWSACLCMDGTCLCMNWWMELAYVICMDGSCLCMNGLNLLMYECMELMCWIYVICLLLNRPVKYIYICHIYLLWKLLDLIKNRKKSQYAGSLPSATDGNGLFAVSRRRQRSHMAANCASWELTHLVSLPTVADGKDTRKFAYSGRRQRVKEFAVSGGRQRPAM